MDKRRYICKKCGDEMVGVLAANRHRRYYDHGVILKVT